MSIRVGMADLVARLRTATNASDNDHTILSQTFFSDDMLQARLDNYQETDLGLVLVPCPRFIDGAYVYLDYVVPAHISYDFEGPAPDSHWRAYNSLGTAYVLDTDYTLNLAAGRLTFTQDLAGAFVYLDCQTYNVHRAAADVWREKAAFAATESNWQSDNHRIEAAAVFEHCMELAALLRGLRGHMSPSSRGRIAHDYAQQSCSNASTYPRFFAGCRHTL